jgi:hypothetical protein
VRALARLEGWATGADLSSFEARRRWRAPQDDGVYVWLPTWNYVASITLSAFIGEFAMRVFLGMILGALLLVAGVYIYDSQSTSTVANGQTASANRTIVNWDVAATDWNLLKRRAQDDWVKLSSK